LGVDVGGTFTDFALVDDAGDVIEAKTPSTPDNPGEAIERGLVELSNRLGRPLDAFLADCRLLIHGTTVALNALLQQKGARTGLVCTDGFRDTLEIRLGYRDRRYDFRYPPPPILVPRHLRRPVRERVDKLGRIVIPLVAEDVLRAIEVFKREGVASVAVCLLWSFYNEEHERTIGRLVEQAMPASTTGSPRLCSMRTSDRGCRATSRIRRDFSASLAMAVRFATSSRTAAWPRET
jgi:N-methylhydantoinase A